ncbi:MAG TPA: hypothetical protein VIU62_22245 [Chloroflexota bacterium]|jgi:hypothetical protein
MSAPDWRQVELEATWFPLVERAEQLRRDKHLDWATIARFHLYCSVSALRSWRRRYWEAERLAS